MAGIRHTKMDVGDDPFANFSLTPAARPPQPGAKVRSSSRNRYSSLAGLNNSRRFSMSGSYSNLGGLTPLSGSMQNLLDSSKMMSLQEDAKSRRISTEVMKHRLYESVLTSPRRRRFSMRSDYTRYNENDDQCHDNGGYYAQSMPVTPAHSQNVSPATSPTAIRRFRWNYWSSSSRGGTPGSEVAQEMVQEEEECKPEDAWKGLPSLFRPNPRCISAFDPPALQRDVLRLDDLDDQDMEDEEDMDTNLMPPPPCPPVRRHPKLPHQQFYSGEAGDAISSKPQFPVPPDELGGGNVPQNSF